MNEVLTLCHRHKRSTTRDYLLILCDISHVTGRIIFFERRQKWRGLRGFSSLLSLFVVLVMINILSRSFPVIFCLYVSVFKFRFQASILSPRAIPRYQGGGLMDWKFLEATPQNLGIFVIRIVVAQCRLVPLGELLHQVNRRQLQCLLANN